MENNQKVYYVVGYFCPRGIRLKIKCFQPLKNLRRFLKSERLQAATYTANYYKWLQSPISQRNTILPNCHNNLCRNERENGKRVLTI